MILEKMRRIHALDLQVSDLPSVPLEVEEVKCPAPKSSCDFQNVFQSVLEEGQVLETLL